MEKHPFKVVSGGQTGVDRAALDAALVTGIPAGGWCPRGRLAEDGTIPEHYPLREAPSPEPAVRTELNVRDSDGTLILTPAHALTEGTLYTLQMTIKHRRPCLLILIKEDRKETPALRPSESITVIHTTPDELTGQPKTLARKVIDWLERNNISTLNVAGPRESKAPGIYQLAFCLLKVLFCHLLTNQPSTGKDCDDETKEQSPHACKEK